VQTTNVSETLHQPESHVGNKAVDGDAAVDILAELRRQQEEQKQLIHEQREIVNELRRHENVAHHVHDDHKYQVCGCECMCEGTMYIMTTSTRCVGVSMGCIMYMMTTSTRCVGVSVLVYHVHNDHKYQVCGCECVGVPCT